MDNFRMTQLSIRIMCVLAVIFYVVLGNSIPIYAESTNLIVNGDIESASSGQPTGWQFNQWGDVVASGSYVDRDGGHALKVAVTEYRSGDAKWCFDPITVDPNTSYTFSDEYKTTSPSEVIIRFTHTDGSYSYETLAVLPTTNNWETISYSITTPANAKEITVFHILNQPGELYTDNFVLMLSPVHPDDNLVPNGSAESAIGSMPLSWKHNFWGQLNATFSYENTGQDGDHSMKVMVSNYVDGDAKWYFNPVPVEANKTYQFSNDYHSNVPTDILVRYTKTDGSFQYDLLGILPAQTIWTATKYEFTTPADTTEVTVFHVVHSNGELWVDNYKLFEIEKLETPTEDIINPSLETVSSSNPDKPEYWESSSWGNNNATFRYLNEGYTGNRSVQLQITNYTDGDAKWYFEPIKLVPGKEYEFNNYYKSTANSRIVLAVTNQDGTIQYIELPGAPPATNWTKYSSSFVMPTNGEKVTVYHLLSSVGQLTTDDYRIKPYQAEGFARGMVTLTFDDSWEDNVDTALPIMKTYGYKSNQFYATTFIKNPIVTDPKAILQKFKDAGHEIGSHTVTHPDLTTLTAAQVDAELRNSKTYLEKYLSIPIHYFATPYGAYNQTVKEKIMQYYTVHRTVDAGFNSKDNFDLSKLKVQNILSTTTAEEVRFWVNKAYEEKTWLILVYHRVANDPGPYDTTPELFTNQLQEIKAKGIPVLTFSQAIAEIQSQM